MEFQVRPSALSGYVGNGSGFSGRKPTRISSLSPSPISIDKRLSPQPGNRAYHCNWHKRSNMQRGSKADQCQILSVNYALTEARIIKLHPMASWSADLAISSRGICHHTMRALSSVGKGIGHRHRKSSAFLRHRKASSWKASLHSFPAPVNSYL